MQLKPLSYKNKNAHLYFDEHLLLLIVKN